jgi:hypothetical protein
VDSPVTISSIGVGLWVPINQAYSFISGCYSFVSAINSSDAYATLANPTVNPQAIVHARFSGSSWSTPASGAC